MTWIAALVNTCPDCLPRHGQTKPMSQWRLLGLPRSGWSVCGRNCKCVLVPAFDMDDPGHRKLIAPLQRETARLMDKKLGGASVRIPAGLLQSDPANLSSSKERRDEIRKSYEGDERVRRLMRKLGSINAGNGGQQ